jgi:hypothetical protein
MQPLILSLLAAAALVVAAPATATSLTYGSAMPEGKAQPIAAVMADADAQAGRTLKVEGRITQVCQKTGCWLMLDNAGQGVRVRTQHEFFVPKDASGQAIVHGELTPTELTEAQARHYVDDGSGPSTPGREWQILATSIVINP